MHIQQASVMCVQRPSFRVRVAGRPGAISYPGLEMPSLRFLQHQAADDRQERTQAASASAAAVAHTRVLCSKPDAAPLLRREAAG